MLLCSCRRRTDTPRNEGYVGSAFSRRCYNTAAAAIASIYPSVSFLISAAEGTAFESYAAVLLKAIGIGYCTVITADACRGAGADTAASGIELWGELKYF